jgi:hypothetical protein
MLYFTGCLRYPRLLLTLAVLFWSGNWIAGVTIASRKWAG